METKRQVLVMITPLSRQRINGILAFAQRHDWSLTFHDRLGGLPPSFGYDGILATLRADESTLAYVREARRRGIPVVDLTIQHPRIRLPRVISDHAAIGRLAGAHFRERGLSRAAWFSTGWSNVHRIRLGGFAEALGFAPEKWVTPEADAACAFLRRARKPPDRRMVGDDARCSDFGTLDRQVDDRDASAAGFADIVEHRLVGA